MAAIKCSQQRLFNLRFSKWRGEKRQVETSYYTVSSITSQSSVVGQCGV